MNSPIKNKINSIFAHVSELEKNLLLLSLMTFHFLLFLTRIDILLSFVMVNM